ncbi:MAG TPA: O-antigen ligase family protein, partial [Acidobacteriota bacterium]|nr:O-antigen ligase family protein [Acidobacteriota bacterium]
PLDWAIGGLGLMILATCFVVPDIEFSMGKIAGALYGILLYYAAVALIRTERAIKAGLYAFILVGVALAAFGIVGAILGPEQAFIRILPELSKHIPKHNWALPGAEAGINPNAVGGSLLWVIPLALFLVSALLSKANRVTANAPAEAEGCEPDPIILNSTHGATQEAGGAAGIAPYRPEWGLSARRPGHLLGLICLTLASVVLLVALFLSQSYGAWIALILSVWLIGLSPKWKIWSLAGALVLCGAIFTIGPLRRAVGPIARTVTPVTGAVVNPTGNVVRVKIEQRYGFWTAGLGAIRRAPVFGVGMNRLRLDPGINFENAHAHNQFITTGAELGIPGLVAYIALLMGAGWMAWVIWRRSKDRWMRAAALGLIAGQVAFHIFGLGDAIPLGSKPNALLWVSLALITAIYKNSQAKA